MEKEFVYYYYDKNGVKYATPNANWAFARALALGTELVYTEEPSKKEQND